MANQRKEAKPLATDAERLTQAALQGFFGDAEGFLDLETINRKRAVVAVEKVLFGK